jgi:hypothetical protein
VTGRDITIALIFLVIGWCAHLLWDWFTDWLYDTTGRVHGFLWDLCAWVGIAALCLGIGFAVTR